MSAYRGVFENGGLFLNTAFFSIRKKLDFKITKINTNIKLKPTLI
uniref:Uncharacterized protein n=1 Tax=Cryptophlebia leucotreta granulosis virus TaxID=35254 RepID=A0A2H4ZKJ3_GVCL|nr:hypothetical protein [Cryptophlebia leucotreta granulovirus]